MEAFFIDSHLETFFISFSNHGFFTNSWICLIFLTAATLGFWRIQSYFHHKAAASSAADSSASLFCDSPIQYNEPRQCSNTVVQEPCSHGGVSEGDQVGGFTTRGKFTVYLEEDVDDNFESNSFDVDWNCSVGEVVRECTMCVVTRSERWYDYQDLTVFDGNVVKLWEAQKLGYPLLEKVKVSGRLCRVY